MELSVKVNSGFNVPGRYHVGHVLHDLVYLKNARNSNRVMYVFVNLEAYVGIVSP